MQQRRGAGTKGGAWRVTTEGFRRRRCGVIVFARRGRIRLTEVVAVSKPGQVNREQMIRQLIAVRAYEIWESQGRPHGHDAAHWRQAEQDIMACLADGMAEAPAAPKGRVPPGQSGRNR